MAPSVQLQLAVDGRGLKGLAGVGKVGAFSVLEDGRQLFHGRSSGSNKGTAAVGAGGAADDKRMFKIYR